MNTAFPVLLSERCRLRQIQDSDLEDIFRGLSDPEVIRYYGVSCPTREAVKQQLRWFKKLEEEKTGIWWAVCSREKNGRFLGAGGLNNLSADHRKAEVGYWLLPESWNRGIMTETLPLIVDYGFKTMGLHRIEGFVETENSRVKKVIEKLGFIHEGTMHQCEMKNGVFISLDIYAKLYIDALFPRQASIGR